MADSTPLLCVSQKKMKTGRAANFPKIEPQTHLLEAPEMLYSSHAWGKGYALKRKVQGVIAAQCPYLYLSE
jgi:hypothetical protein